MSRTARQNRKTKKPERDNYNRRTHSTSSCRHHGGCPYCERNRTLERAPALKEEIKLVTAE